MFHWRLTTCGLPDPMPGQAVLMLEPGCEPSAQPMADSSAPELLATPSVLEFHPGAARAYSEAGLSQ